MAEQILSGLQLLNAALEIAEHERKARRSALQVEARKHAVCMALDQLEREMCLEPEAKQRMLIVYGAEDGEDIDSMLAESYRADVLKLEAEMQVRDEAAGKAADVIAQLQQDAVARAATNAELLERLETARKRLRDNGLEDV